MSSSHTETHQTPTTVDPGAGPAAAVEVVMPQMGVSVAEGTIAAWLKGVGDRIAADEPICEVTTDKIDIEIPAPAAGVVEEILVEEGETVVVGTVIARIAAGSTAPPAGPVRDDPPQAAADAGPAGGPHPGHPRKSGDASPGAPAGVAHPAGAEIDRSWFYSPVVRRIAEEHGVDLEAVEGRGVGGRVRKADVVAYIEQRPANGNGNGRPLHTESPYRPDPVPPLPSRLPAHRLAGPPRSPRIRRARYRLPSAAASTTCSGRPAASRWTRCARRSPRTWSAAARRRRTARPWSRPTSRRSRASARRARRSWRDVASR